MRKLPVFIYLRQADTYGRPLSLSQFIFSYAREEREEFLDSPGVCHAVDADGRPLSFEELLTHVRRTETALERQIFDQCFSRDDFARYIADYPEGTFVELAKDMVERLDFSRCQTPAEYANYLELYPKGKFASPAKERSKGTQVPKGSKERFTPEKLRPSSTRQRTYRRASESYRETQAKLPVGSLS